MICIFQPFDGSRGSSYQPSGWLSMAGGQIERATSRPTARPTEPLVTVLTGVNVYRRSTPESPAAAHCHWQSLITDREPASESEGSFDGGPDHDKASTTLPNSVH